MTVIEMQVMSIIKTSLPKIVGELERVATALENANSLKRFELSRIQGADLEELEEVMS